MKVLAAMSGGVDSAVAASRAVAAGHDVTGVHLALSSKPASSRVGARGCCTLEDAHDARRAADVLGIPFYVWDFAARFKAAVIDNFVDEYAAGRTPNPCLRCNEQIKFTALLDKALALGFDALCTGHYAQIVDSDSGRELHRGVDNGKDQSYVLGVLTADQLRHSMFPCGSSTKESIRAEASGQRLAVADKPDSHDVCFIPDGDTAGWLHSRIGDAEGAIVDEAGDELGRHDGAFAFTVGQRRGLALDRPAADGRARYVLSISAVDSTVTVGPAEALDVRELTGIRASWTQAPIAGPLDCLVQVRAHAEPVPATVSATDGTVTMTLHRPVRGVATGQAAVLYDGTRVLGAATISATAR
ncbi:MAG: tRNA 2-thiouridine(34) synthase MnmA [Actinomycetota bacterium]